MNTITINSIRKETDSNYTDLVTIVNYNLSITRGSETENDDFQCTLGYPEPSSGLFIQYSSISENDVKDWVVGTPEYASDLASLELIINERTATNISGSGLPWNS